MRKIITKIARKVFWSFTIGSGLFLLILLVFLSTRLYFYWENKQGTKAKELEFVDYQASGLISLIQTIVTAAGGIGVLINIRLTENRSLTQRFSDAVHQLGNNSFDIRLGGIYALERIAKDSARDHWTIIEILVAYIRKRTSSLNGDQYQEDVQSVIFVLGRRNHWNDQGSIYLIQTNLNTISFEGSNFDEAVMRNVQLKHSNLMKASFKNADLKNADLSGANLIDANLSGADLTDANLSGATLYSTNLRNTKLYGANLTGSLLFPHPELQKKHNFKGAIFTGANVRSANFTGAYFLPKQLDYVKGKNDAIIPKQSMVDKSIG